jgi:hypothetical protein
VIQFHGEQISADPREVDPQHLAPNDAMVFSQVIASCKGEEANGNDIIGVEVTYTKEGSRERKTVSTERRFNEMLAAEALELIKGDTIIAYAETAKIVLTGTYSNNCYYDEYDDYVCEPNESSQLACDDLENRLAYAKEMLPGDEEIAEISDLGGKLCTMNSADAGAYDEEGE